MESWLGWLPQIGAVLMLLIGLVGLVNPWPMLKPMAITAASTMGQSEIRAVFGGLHIGAASSALLLQEQAAFVVIGSMWCGALLGHIYSIFADGGNFKENATGFVVNGLLAALLLSSLL